MTMLIHNPECYAKIQGDPPSKLDWIPGWVWFAGIYALQVLCIAGFIFSMRLMFYGLSN